MNNRNKIPLVTLIILLVVAVFHFYPSSFALLVYHRDKIMKGEWWRVITGHLIHGSTEHVIRDGASFLFFGSILEHRLLRIYIAYLLGAALMISGTYLLFKPDILTYCGLSGVITGLCGYLLMQELPRTWPRVGKESSKLLFSFYLIMTSVLIFKVTYEFLSGGSFFYRDQAMKAAPEAHVVGLLSGILAWSLQRWMEKDHSLPEVPRWSVIIALSGGLTWLGMVLFW